MNPSVSLAMGKQLGRLGPLTSVKQLVKEKENWFQTSCYLLKNLLCVTSYPWWRGWVNTYFRPHFCKIVSTQHTKWYEVIIFRILKQSFFEWNKPIRKDSTLIKIECKNLKPTNIWMNKQTFNSWQSLKTWHGSKCTHILLYWWSFSS